MNAEPHLPSVEEMRSAAESDNPYGSMDPEEFNRGLAKIREDALRDAASALRVADGYSPYVGVSHGMAADGWGRSSEDIDNGYADWLNEQADKVAELHTRLSPEQGRLNEVLLRYLWERTPQSGFQARAGDLCIRKDSTGRFSTHVPDVDPVGFDSMTVIALHGEWGG